MMEKSIMEIAAYIAAGFGAALIVFGAANGISKIGSSALDGMSRQPEAAGKIQTAMILASVLIEGAAIIGLVVCILLAVK